VSADPTRATASAYAARTNTKPPNWHALVAWDVLFNNLTTGLYLTAALGELAAPRRFAAVADVAYPLALALLTADLLCLIFDLGDPWRFHHMLRVFKPSSPMSFGTWALAAYSLPLTVVVATEVLPSAWAWVAWVRWSAVLVGTVPALAAAVYKGVLLSTNAQPGWRDARWLGGYLTSAAFLLGCGGMLALSVLMGRDEAASSLRVAFVPLLVLNAVPLALLVADLRPALARSYRRPQLWRLAVACFGATVVLPPALILLGGTTLTLAGVLSLLCGSLLIRFVIVGLPHQPHGPQRPAAT
jgi:hypothetical protein